MTLAAFPLVLPLDGNAPRRTLVEHSYDMDGTGQLCPVLVLELLTPAEETATEGWVESPSPSEAVTQARGYVAEAEALVDLIQRSRAAPEDRMAIASAVLALVALGQGVDDTDAVATYFAETMQVMVNLKGDLKLIEDEDGPDQEPDPEAEFAA